MSEKNSVPETDFPLRLAFTGADGFPRIVSLWYLAEGGKIFCVTHDKSFLKRRLDESGNVAFEISNNEPPYKGTRGTAKVVTYPLADTPLLERLLNRYVGSLEGRLAELLLLRKESEIIIELTPVKQSSWDFTERMSDAVA
ncbi:MAG: hypothetical protein V7711_05830 [Pseudomonadales bacterium]